MTVAQAAQAFLALFALACGIYAAVWAALVWLTRESERREGEVRQMAGPETLLGKRVRVTGGDAGGATGRIIAIWWPDHATPPSECKVEFEHVVSFHDGHRMRRYRAMWLHTADVKVIEEGE